MAYPTTKDSFQNVNPSDPRNNPSLAGLVTNVGNTVEAIQDELGFGASPNSPRGTFSNLTARLAAMAASLVPVGTVAMYIGGSAPSGWLLCDGASYAQSAFPALFAVVGTTYGGSGSNFNVPDMKGRFPLGRRLTGQATVLGQAGGALGHTHTQPTHQHSQPLHQHNVNPTVTETGDMVGEAQTQLPASGGFVHGGAHHHNLNIPPFLSGSGGNDPTGASGDDVSGAGDPPYLVVHFIVKAV